MSSRKSAKTASAALTVKDATFGLLRAFGIKRVFGNPGSTELPFLSDWPDDIDYVLGLQEASRRRHGRWLRAGDPQRRLRQSAFRRRRRQCARQYLHRPPQPDAAGHHRRPAGALDPAAAGLSLRRARFRISAALCQIQRRAGAAEDVPAAIARAYYVAMQPPCGPTFVSIPIDDWTRPTQPIEARRVSRELGPDPEAMKALVAALAASKRPALVVGPGVDRAGAVDLMVQVAEKAKAAVWVSPFSARCSFPERHPQFAGFLHASPGQLSDALRDHDLVVVIGAPVFTFHVEGHAAIFDGATTIFQITDDPDAAAVTPSGASIIATMKPALAMLLDLLPESKRAMPAGRTLPPAPSAADPLPVEFLLHSLSEAMPANAVLVEEAPSHRPAMQKFMPMRGQDSFYTMSSGGLGYSLPAAVGMALGRPGDAHRLPDRRRLGDVFDPGAVDRGPTQAAAHGGRHQQRRLRRDAFVQPGDAGAQRAGAGTARHRFRQTRRRHGLPRRAGDEIIRTRRRAQATGFRMTAPA